MSGVSEKDLRAELNDMRERHPSLKDDELFVAWFMKCFITDTEDEAVNSLVGGPRDKSLDAIHIDDPAKKVYVVQGKYRQRLGTGAERRSDVLALADLARSFTDEGAYRSYRVDLANAALGKVDEARRRIKSRGYGVHLYYLTTGKCSPALAAEARRIAARDATSPVLDVLDGKRVLHLLSDYLDGVAPPVPMLEVELENGHGIKRSGVLQRFDPQAKIDSWVVPVGVDQIARMYETAGIRLFARNVRGFLGITQINRNIRSTLETEPDHFWYYNNGITIVCDSAELLNRQGKEVLRLVNPQVINGQQTTRTLHECGRSAGKAAVLVRVISVPRETPAEASRFENLVSKIVAATNWQNAIRASDLMANDRRQVELERRLRKLGYQYLRKRQSKGEARQAAGIKYAFQLTKEELAQAVAACDSDPAFLREGKEKLFEEARYAAVFPNADPAYYLPRYWLSRTVSRRARGYPERAYAKWLVLNFVWQRLMRLLGTRVAKEVFRNESERGGLSALSTAIDAGFRAAGSYFSARRGTGETRVDVSNFFKRVNHHVEFQTFWRSQANRYRSTFDKAWRAFEDQFRSALDN